MVQRSQSSPIIILSATSFRPLCGQSVSDTPDAWSSDRRLVARGLSTCSETSRYALKRVTDPNSLATRRIASAASYPVRFAGIAQFSVDRQLAY